ncbi:MAG TPA: DNA-directed RNA polymerase subunit beta [Candidatus Megaira endosymbiont of Hartmannula sinica]|nr:DNA-directed RNA polymerase subunit beta [Candidatus Megaera endosymbiont of Hartmannula sinica]
MDPLLNQNIYRIRKDFSKIKSITSIPNLIELQKNSYNESFLQLSSDNGKRKDKGLELVFHQCFQLKMNQAPLILILLDIVSISQKYDVNECLRRGVSYTASLRAVLRLSIWDIDEEAGVKEIKSIKEQEVYMGDIPLMTQNGTFIINGTERVIVSQMHRSPGVFFYHDEGKTHLSGKYLYSARIIPYRGSWLDFEFDPKDTLYFRIDRKRKLPVTTLLIALGMSRNDIIDYYYPKKQINFNINLKKWTVKFEPEEYLLKKLSNDIICAETGEIIISKGSRVTNRLLDKIKEKNIENIIFDSDNIIGSYIGEDIVNSDGEVISVCGDIISEEIFEKIINNAITNFSLIQLKEGNAAYLIDTLAIDKNVNKHTAFIDIFKILRPGEPASSEAGELLFNSLFFNNDRYDLLEVGRVKINSSLNHPDSIDSTYLDIKDVKEIIKKLINIKDGIGSIDDIDHLGNRRVRPVGELVENQVRIAFTKMEKNIKERMAGVDPDSVMPYDLINSKILGTSLREFFGTSQLSQFMDQTNPLSEVGHKRKLSALGPGGVSRERVGFEVRDVHPTHYGRICPIETPEGQNIGLINSMATHAKVNKYGFIESPYRKVESAVVTGNIVYLSADQEGRYNIAQASTKIDDNGKIIGENVVCRTNDGDFVTVTPDEVDFIDVTPKQVVSVAASLIPFLENDDANRALMGSNMQRQAVPLIKPDAPFVGTGMERVVAKDSGATIVALNDGMVEEVDSSRIIISVAASNDNNASSPEVDIYNLSKFQRSNHNTCINQKPLVTPGNYVKKGDVIADGPSIDKAEIALGRNVLVAFVSWGGYNFEDAILISERIVSDDVFTSVHIEEFEVIARDTRIGPEEITSDIPNVPDSALANLDESGIVNIGADIKSGDILVGKVTPKSESPVTPEERLLRAIFGEKAADVKDSSLYTPPGINGTVVDVRVFSRRGVDKNQRSLAIEKNQIDRLTSDKNNELEIMQDFLDLKIKKILLNHVIVKSPNKDIKKGQVIDEKIAHDIVSERIYWDIIVEDNDMMLIMDEIKKQYHDKKKQINEEFNSKVEKIQSGDDLPQGVLKMVKIFVATKLKLQPGDKMAGRHGNKGVVSKIVPQEDMPFLEDGTPVDIVLNPLGLPSRMNVGQVLETHLGMAAKALGIKIGNMVDSCNDQNINPNDLKKFVKDIFQDNEISNKIDDMDNENFLKFADRFREGIYFSTPVFDGAKADDVKRMLEMAGLDKSGQVRLLDGRTGEYFDRPVTVGYKYILKLHHLVDNKMHARSVGPYSMVTQQPLGGKSHFGGQRFGEMECWALQAYGAAYTLQEMLTVKSDDVNGRVRMYETIVKGENNFESGIPESFNVMIKELRSLCLNMQLVDKDEKEKN